MMGNDILDNVKYLIIFIVTGIVLIALGSAFSLAFLSLFGGFFIGVPLLLVIIGIILQARE